MRPAAAACERGKALRCAGRCCDVVHGHTGRLRRVDQVRSVLQGVSRVGLRGIRWNLNWNFTGFGHSLMVELGAVGGESFRWFGWGE
jgi:hypothetical protein